mgnify:CR=1 FL=1
MTKEERDILSNQELLDKHLEKAREFYKWLNDCPFEVSTIAYGKRGETKVTFIWWTSNE